MVDFQTRVKSLFRTPSFVPDKASLVDFDGFDELEKNEAIKAFLGKNSNHLLEHLSQGGIYYLEEWSVLKKNALIYYCTSDSFCAITNGN